jgi:hypothetical protein
VLVALDNDPLADGFLQGKAPPPEGTPPGLPFAGAAGRDRRAGAAVDVMRWCVGVMG